MQTEISYACRMIQLKQTWVLTHLNWEGELWVSVMQENDSLGHAHTLPDTDVVWERWLLHLDGHVHHSNVGIVKTVQYIGLTKVKGLKW